MISYGRQFIDGSDIKEVVKVLKSDWLTQGPRVADFEKKMAEYCGAKYAIALSNGTTALHLAYLISGLKEGDEVITTPNTFVATCNMLLVVGAKPIFCDISLDDYNIDETKIEKLITPKTKAIVPVDFAGHPANIKKILKIARKYNLLVIEDACHSLGAYAGKDKIGNLADITVFSFHPVKPITTGEGGAILTNNKNMYKKALLLRSHGVIKDKKGKNVMLELGFNYRITDIQAALGISQLRKLDKLIEKRRKIADFYKRKLTGIKEIFLPKESENCRSGWHIYVVRVKDKRLRPAFVEFLINNGISANFHYPAVYSHPYYRHHGYQNLKLGNMEKYQSTCITIPLHPLLTTRELNYICAKIREFFDS